MTTDVEREIRERILEDRRPWGRFRQFAHNQVCTVKIITVAPHQTLSLQRHQHRDELWVILDPGLEVTLDDRTWRPRVGEEIVIVRRSKHRLASTGPAARLLEVAFGEFDEDDIERFEDVYGRG